MDKKNAWSTKLSTEAILENYRLLYQRFCDCQQMGAKRGRPTNFDEANLTIFFTVMMVRRIHTFKGMSRWIYLHPSEAVQYGFQRTPDRTTLSRRYKKLGLKLPSFIEFIYRDSIAVLGEKLDSEILYIDSSIFKACGNVWHVWDKVKGEKPKRLRKIDEDAGWTKGGYHQFQYGYKIHVILNHHRFPALIEAEIGSVHDAKIFDRIEYQILSLKPKYIIGDNSYCACRRIKNLSELGIDLLTPGGHWTNTKPAKAYHQKIAEDEPKRLLEARRVVIEPFFDLLAKFIGATSNHKQLEMMSLNNVRTTFMLAFIGLQICMRMNIENGEPQSRISVFMSLLK